MPRTPRALRGLLAVVVVLAVAGLTGCRTDPSVAAYVGDGQISVVQLQSAVDQRLGDPGVAAAVKGKESQFSRLVLGRLVEERVYAAVARDRGLQIGNDQVQAQVAFLLGGQDPTQVYEQLAGQGIARQDVTENVRQQLIRQQIAAAEGLPGGLSDQALQARYAQVRGSLAQVQLGYITVPDQATATAVLAQLTASPAAYPALAAKYPGNFTLPQPQSYSSDQVPAPLAAAVSKAAPNTGFTVPVAETGGIVVGFVTGVAYPSYQDVRSQLVQEATTAIDQKANPVVDKVRSRLHVTVNPRYGVYKDGSVQTDTGGVVDILSSGTAASGS
jgi:peptidyl-prolyl cis-trans isomerase SurA